MSPAEVLRRAADYIAEHGWRQRSPGEHGGPRCAGGAILSAAGVASGGFDGVAYGCAREALLNHLDWQGHSGLIGPWNDTPGRTAEEVIATLRSVADRIDRGGR